jgi:hypothetical protein
MFMPFVAHAGEHTNAAAADTAARRNEERG